MARYKALRRGFPGRQVEPGEEFEFSGVPGSWMEPVDEEARKAFTARFGEDYRPDRSVEDRRPIGAAPVGSPVPAQEVARLQKQVAQLQGIIDAAGLDRPKAEEPPAEIDPKLAAAIDKRRARQKEQADG